MKPMNLHTPQDKYSSGQVFPRKVITKTFDHQSFLTFTISGKGLWACTNDSHKVQKLGPDFIPKSWLDIFPPTDCPSGHLAQRKHTYKAHRKRKLNELISPEFFLQTATNIIAEECSKVTACSVVRGIEKSTSVNNFLNSIYLGQGQ